MAVQQFPIARGDTPIETVPVGTILTYAGASAPAGWLVCDGSAISRSTFAALYAVVGTTYGAGDGSTTFNVPDARGRTIMGAGVGAGGGTSGASGTAPAAGQTLTNRVRGAWAGDERSEQHSHTNTLTNATTGTSGHTHTTGNHQHPSPWPVNTGGGTNGPGMLPWNTPVFGISGTSVNYPNTGLISISGSATAQTQYPYLTGNPETLPASGGPSATQTVGITNVNANSGTGANLPPILVTTVIIKAFVTSGIVETFTPSPNRNLLANGDMRICQRGNATGVTDAYVLDRYKVVRGGASTFDVAQDTADVPAGFAYAMKITVNTADVSVVDGDYASIFAPIEGYDVAHLGWGAAGASPVTLSFWVKSSVAGLYSGSIRNYAANRSYPFSFDVTTAWAKVIVTIPGDTTGTWEKGSNAGLHLFLTMTCGSPSYRGAPLAWGGANYIATTTQTANLAGTAAATFRVTGVQLEAGTVATPFEVQPIQQQVARCQRYFYRAGGNVANECIAVGYTQTTSVAVFILQHPVKMRVPPTPALTGTVTVIYGNANNTTSASMTDDLKGPQTSEIYFTTPAVLTAGGAVRFTLPNTSTYIDFSAEM
jgi:microcystin-dependent protein